MDPTVPTTPLSLDNMVKKAYSLKQYPWQTWVNMYASVTWSPACSERHFAIPSKPILSDFHFVSFGSARSSFSVTLDMPCVASIHNASHCNSTIAHF